MTATHAPNADCRSGDSLVPPDAQAWDLVVLGGGTAGLVGAKTAAGFGASVLLVEADRTGGDCLWTGCVPSKALLAAAHAAAAARSAARLGVHTDPVRVEFGQVMKHVHDSIAAIAPQDAPDSLRAAGVCVTHARARLINSEAVLVGDVAVPFRQVLLATGSAPAWPPVAGLSGAGALTTDTVWQLTELPERLLVLGGGSIGCELGQAFARLGARVSIVEALPRLLSGEDADAAEAVTAALVADGVNVRTGVEVREVSGVQEHRAGGTLTLSDGETLEYDALLVAAGRSPRTGEIGLEGAGVEVNDRGYVRVNARLQTTNPRIWAAGDLTGHPQFTHTAGVHASLAASNAVLGLRRRVHLGAIPRVTYTQPEVGSVGVGAEEAERSGFAVRTQGHDGVDRAVTEGDANGFSRMVLDRKGRVVGATIVGPRAGESLAEAVLAVQHGLRTRDLATTIHAYPTFADGLWKPAVDDVDQRLHHTVARHAVTTLVAARRRWVRR